MRRVVDGGRRSRRSLLAGISGAAMTAVGSSRASGRQAGPDYWPTNNWRVADPEEFLVSGEVRLRTVAV